MESNPQIELDAAQALFAARLLEAAVHHKGPWEFQWGEIRIPAEKTFTSSGVVFSGEFPDLCWIEPPDGSLLLICDNIIMGMRAIDEGERPGDTGFAVSWKVLLSRPTEVSAQ